MVASHIVVMNIIGYSEEPCGEVGEPTKLLQIGVCFDERVLCEVVAQLFIAQRLVEEESPYRRLIFHNQAVERLTVVKNSHLGDERDIA